MLYYMIFYCIIWYCIIFPYIKVVTQCRSESLDHYVSFYGLVRQSASFPLSTMRETSYLMATRWHSDYGWPNLLTTVNKKRDFICLWNVSGQLCIFVYSYKKLTFLQHCKKGGFYIEIKKAKHDLWYNFYLMSALCRLENCVCPRSSNELSLELLGLSNSSDGLCKNLLICLLLFQLVHC